MNSTKLIAFSVYEVHKTTIGEDSILTTRLCNATKAGPYVTPPMRESHPKTSNRSLQMSTNLHKSWTRSTATPLLACLNFFMESQSHHHKSSQANAVLGSGLDQKETRRREWQPEHRLAFCYLWEPTANNHSERTLIRCQCIRVNQWTYKTKPS